MATVTDYPVCIKQVLRAHQQFRSIPNDSVQAQVLFDDEHQNYMLLDLGWQGKRYIHSPVIHLEIVAGKVWIRCNYTEFAIADELIAAGIPREDIVLGFQHPTVRPYTGFAAVA